MKVALIGGTGFVGSYLIDELIKNDHTPRLLVREGSENKVIQKDKCETVTGDIDDDHSIEKFETHSDVRDNGKLIRYFRSGRLKEIKNYKDGKLDGPYVLYEDNNKNDIIESSFYEMGKKSFE